MYQPPKFPQTVTVNGETVTVYIPRDHDEVVFDKVVDILLKAPTPRGLLRTQLQGIANTSELDEALAVLEDLEVLGHGQVLRQKGQRGRPTTVYWIENLFRTKPTPGGTGEAIYAALGYEILGRKEDGTLLLSP